MLSLLVPAVVLLDKRRFHTRHGTGVLIVTPNRETAVEISGLASELLAGTTHTVGMVIEGANRGSEEEKLERGVNLLVATPVRLLEHLKDLPSFVIKNMKAFFVYGPGAETDKQIREIITYIPKKSRISAVVTEKADEFQGLVELVCRPDSIQRYELASSVSTAAKGPQGYGIVEADKRFLLLYSFLKKFQRKKIVVLVSSTLSVLFCEEALSSLELSVYSVHGRQNAKSRLTAFSDFLKDAEGTLVCTEEAVHGLEVPPADWVIHYDPPTSVKDFICRRGAIQGRPVAFTLPEESGFVDALKAADVAVEEFDFPKNKLINVQSKLEKLVSKNFELHQAAKNGFRAFLQDYNHHVDAKIFDVSKLDVQKVAKSFGFDTPPRVEIKVEGEVIVDKFKRTYGPEKPKSGKKRKAQ
ncbi:P-loop containing nucleoside triphosphate hydrolase protein [Sphaerosporella brunnea]|uniref:ATP-dependent RNA helicase n=1 Tax=Sphaerosporella brunnea TaxID=1250544 RepID=A0A5J5EWF1_9PEZI|nr:P-loop containing nucleoside triphosphate hydrolase protein [Sphaerosporella brunnea]